MKKGDLYDHCKGVEYYFDGIALPVENRRRLRKTQTARYHEDTHDIQLYTCDNGVTYIDAEVPHVIYQSENHYDTSFVYAREVDDFFGYKVDENGKVIPRFRQK